MPMHIKMCILKYIYSFYFYFPSFTIFSSFPSLFPPSQIRAVNTWLRRQYDTVECGQVHSHRLWLGAMQSGDLEGPQADEEAAQGGTQATRPGSQGQKAQSRQGGLHDREIGTFQATSKNIEDNRIWLSNCQKRHAQINKGKRTERSQGVEAGGMKCMIL
jgi:hypothetical protein